MSFDEGQRKAIFARADARCEECGKSWHDGYMLECDRLNGHTIKSR